MGNAENINKQNKDGHYTRLEEPFLFLRVHRQKDATES